MSSRIGMDPGAVRQAAAAIAAAAGELDRMVGRTDGLLGSIGASWHGDDATHFHENWVQRHRPALSALGEALHGYAMVASNNAAAQDQASASGPTAAGYGHAASVNWSSVIDGLTSAGGLALTLMDWAPKDVGRYPEAWSNVLSRASREYGRILEHASPSFHDTFDNLPDELLRYKRWGIVHDLNDMHGFVHAASGVSNAIGLVSDGVTVSSDVRHGDYVSAGLDTGTALANQLKGHGSLVGYVGGAALQTWVQVGEAARQVDWSPQGLHEVIDTGPREWVEAFGEAGKELPGQLYTILKFW